MAKKIKGEIEAGMNIKGVKLTPEQDEQMENDELNSCDKCGLVESTYDLIWIDTEDFEPAEGEELKPSAYRKYSALCGNQQGKAGGCYEEELKK